MSKANFPAQKDLVTLGLKYSMDPDAIYHFGSLAKSEGRDESDIDLAILCQAPLNPEDMLQFKAEVSQRFHRDLDVVDLARADTVTAAQVLSEGSLIYCKNRKMLDFYETRIYSQYALLNEERRDIVKAFLEPDERFE